MTPRAPRTPAGKPAGRPAPAPGERWVDYVLLTEVAEAAANPKGHDESAIAASVDTFGFVEPIVRDERTGRLVAGHGRLGTLRALEARELRKRRPRAPDGVKVAGDGRWLVPVIRGWSSTDDAQAQAYLVAANRLTERGGWDDTALAQMLAGIQNADPDLLRVTGFDDAALAALLEAAATSNPAGAPPATEPEALPVVRPDPVSRAGDLWHLGPHRLAVGDATDPAVLARLMADTERATCLWTDPPYGVNYEGKTPLALTVPGDDDGAPQLFADALEACRPHLHRGAAFYVCYADARALPFLTILSTPPWSYRQGLMWCKSSFVLGHSDYHFAHENVAAGLLDDAELPPPEAGHEPIAYGYLTGAKGRGRGRVGWYAGNAESSVLHHPKPRVNPDHPTPKPVALAARLIANSTRRGHVVIDPFAGGGAVLAACHGSGRIARLVEIAPVYAERDRPPLAVSEPDAAAPAARICRTEAGAVPRRPAGHHRRARSRGRVVTPAPRCAGCRSGSHLTIRCTCIIRCSAAGCEGVTPT